MNEYKVVSAPLVLILNTVPLPLVAAAVMSCHRNCRRCPAPARHGGLAAIIACRLNEYKVVSAPLVLILNTVPKLPLPPD